MSTLRQFRTRSLKTTLSNRLVAYLNCPKTAGVNMQWNALTHSNQLTTPNHNDFWNCSFVAYKFLCCNQGNHRQEQHHIGGKQYGQNSSQPQASIVPLTLDLRHMYSCRLKRHKNGETRSDAIYPKHAQRQKKAIATATATRKSPQNNLCSM